MSCLLQKHNFLSYRNMYAGENTCTLDWIVLINSVGYLDKICWNFKLKCPMLIKIELWILKLCSPWCKFWLKLCLEQYIIGVWVCVCSFLDRNFQVIYLSGKGSILICSWTLLLIHGLIPESTQFQVGSDFHIFHIIHTQTNSRVYASLFYLHGESCHQRIYYLSCVTKLRRISL